MPEHKARLSARANPSDESVPCRAATAEQIINDETRIIVSVEEYDWLAEFMDEATPAPRLSEAFRQKLVWDV
jgi:uncharacterized protein (DUF1778 family)